MVVSLSLLGCAFDKFRLSVDHGALKPGGGSLPSDPYLPEALPK